MDSMWITIQIAMWNSTLNCYSTLQCGFNLDYNPDYNLELICELRLQIAMWIVIQIVIWIRRSWAKNGSGKLLIIINRRWTWRVLFRKIERRLLSAGACIITGLWQPSVHSDVAFWFFDVGSSYHCRSRIRKVSDCSPANRERELGLDRRETG